MLMVQLRLCGDGQSDSNPVKSLSEAYNILGENGGTIVVCGDITINETYSFPETSAPIYIRGSLTEHVPAQVLK